MPISLPEPRLLHYVGAVNAASALLIALCHATEPAVSEEIEVVAPWSPPEDAGASTVVSVSEQLGSADLARAVDGVPGTVVRRMGGLGAYSTLSIRASSARQVEVFLDGIPLNPDGDATLDLSELPLRAFEFIEVYRGAGPVGLGSAAMGGVVALRSGAPSGTEVSVGGGSYGTGYARGTVHESGPGGDVLAFADGFVTQGDFPWLDDRGTPSVAGDDRTRIRTNNEVVRGSTLLRLRQGPFSVINLLGARRIGVAGFAWAPFEEVGFQVVQDLAAVSWSREGDRARDDVQVFGRVRHERLDDPVGETDFTPGVEQTGFGSGGVRWVGRRYFAPGWTGALASQARFGSLWGATSPQAARWAITETAGLVVASPEERLTWAPALHVHLGRDWDPSSGRLLFDVAPRSIQTVRLGRAWQLRSQVVRSFRPPDLVERFGDQGALRGNPELQPERGVAADVGVVHAKGRVTAEMVAFARHSRQTIVWLSNAQGVAVASNLDGSQALGVETGTTGALDRVSWSASLSVTHARVRNEDGTLGAPLPGVPAWEWHHRVGPRLGPFQLGHTLDGGGPTPLDSAGIGFTGARWIQGAWASAAWRSLTIELDVANLTDRRTEVGARDPLVSDGVSATRALVDFAGYPLPGRTWWITLSLAP